MKTTARSLAAAAMLLVTNSILSAQQALTIRIEPAHSLKPVSRYLSCACIEDVNHEIYGGLYSQMIFGESFQEPPAGSINNFVSYGGEWTVANGALNGAASEGAKLVHGSASTRIDSAGVELFFPDDQSGNAGLILNVTRPGTGADHFSGYEISLDPGTKTLRLALHRQNYHLLRDVPCDIGTRKWIKLSVAEHDRTIDISIDGKSVLQYPVNANFSAGAVGIRTWHRAAEFRNLWTSSESQKTDLAFVQADAGSVSGMWHPFHRGEASGTAAWIDDQPFVGANAQRISMKSGSGEFGIDNRGLNRQGLGLVADKPYLGHFWARAASAAKLRVSLASPDNSRVYASSDIAVQDSNWHQYDFALTPNASDVGGNFNIALVAPGTVDLGYVFLEPGPWGTFKGLPDRLDVAQGLIDQGVTGLRYGGSMANAQEYRWKKMIGPRDRRQPYRGTWYEHSTNGWGIIDFLNFCEAAKFLPIPDFTIDETPQDMADFIEYVNGPADSTWGSKRVADGHPAPYNLTHLELGNEERVNDTYFKKFEGIARAIWPKYPHIILTVGDFSYHHPITDPMHFDGADGHITSLEAHKKILELARGFDAEVWFDIHVSTETAKRDQTIDVFPTYIDAIDQLANGAKHHVVIFELNANNPAQKRAIANADAILHAEQDGRLPFVSSANCLQVDKQNDNGWDQGLLFMNPTQVWLQPPGYVCQMISRGYEPTQVQCDVSDKTALSTFATSSEDHKTVVLQVLNPTDAPITAKLSVGDWKLLHATVAVQTLAAELNAINTAQNPAAIQPTTKSSLSDGNAQTFSPHSFTIVRLDRSAAR